MLYHVPIGRCTKAIVYANPPDWTEVDGGALKIYPHSQGLESCPDDVTGLRDGNMSGAMGHGLGPGKKMQHAVCVAVKEVVFWFSDQCLCWLCLAM